MIAILYSQSYYWRPAGIELLANDGTIPFAFPVVTCVCHGFTWHKPSPGERLNVVRWYV